MNFAAAAVWVALLMAELPAFGGEKLQLVERPTYEITTHVGKSSDGPGDLSTFSNPVFDAANERQIGTDQGFCIRIVPGKTSECFFTLITPAGQITLEGTVQDSGDSLFTVTGGTGSYAGAKGSMRLHPRDARKSSYDYIFDLL